MPSSRSRFVGDQSRIGSAMSMVVYMSNIYCCFGTGGKYLLLRRDDLLQPRPERRGVRRKIALDPPALNRSQQPPERGAPRYASGDNVASTQREGRRAPMIGEPVEIAPRRIIGGS